jgi:hypothetical protein
MVGDRPWLLHGRSSQPAPDRRASPPVRRSAAKGNRRLTNGRALTHRYGGDLEDLDDDGDNVTAEGSRRKSATRLCWSIGIGGIVMSGGIDDVGIWTRALSAYFGHRERLDR